MNGAEMNELIVGTLGNVIMLIVFILYYVTYASFDGYFNIEKIEW